ncbi:MAG: aconitase X swivel domain-containing protein, partial [Candidatus Heimdallarchaeota archaeon]
MCGGNVSMRVYLGKAIRSMGAQSIEGEIIATKEPITLLGFVDAKTGTITQDDHELNGASIDGKIFVFPRGIGSTVGPYT